MLKEQVKNCLMSVKSRPGRTAARLVLFTAFCAFLAGCWLYRQQEGPREGAPRPLSISAQAEGLRRSAEVLAGVLSREAGRVGSSGDARAEDAALAAALRRVYPELAANGYFVLWRGTVDVCSPLTPDTAGLDFAGQRDARGAYFVRDLADLAARGGGFHSFTPAYERAGSGQNPSPSYESEFIAYAAPVPGTGLHLTWWRPADPAAFSLQAELDDASGRWSLLGLCMAGLSFLGVGVLLRGFRE